MDTTCDWRQECVTTNGLSESLRYAPVYTVFSSSTTSALPKTSYPPTAVQYQARNASQDRPQAYQFEKRGEATTEAPSQSRSIRRPASMRRVPKCSSYSCNICRKVYAQPQGVTRHHRETHSTNICTYCGDFEWGRPYRFKAHLKKRHPEVDPDAALNEATRIHRGTTSMKIYPPRQRDLAATAVYDRRSLRSESQIPLTLDPYAVAKVTAGSPSIASFASYNPQPKSAETKMKRRHDIEDAPEVKFLDVTDAHPVFSYTEDHAQQLEARNLSSV